MILPFLIILPSLGCKKPNGCPKVLCIDDLTLQRRLSRESQHCVKPRTQLRRKIQKVADTCFYFENL
jgi:hypothetical protein